MSKKQSRRTSVFFYDENSKNVRRIDGKIFHPLLSAKTKKKAQTEAEKIRKGYRYARVMKDLEHPGYWVVLVRNKPKKKK